MKLPHYVCATCARTFTRRSALRHNLYLHFDQGLIVEALEYIIWRASCQSLSGSQLFNRRFGRPFFLRKQRMENHESGFKATPRDKYLGAKSHIINQVNTQQFLNDDISIERSDRISDIISPDDPYYEPNRISKLAEVKKLRLDCLGPSSTLDNFIYGLALFTADPELRPVR